MRFSITIPPLGESITHGTLTTWYAKDSQWVEAGQNLYQIETDKISLDGVAEKTGYLRIQVSPGEAVNIHQTIGFIDMQAPSPCFKAAEDPLPPNTLLHTQTLNHPSPRTTRVPLSPLRKTLAENLVKAKNATAATTTFNEVNMERVLQIRQTYQAAFQAKHEVRLGLLPFFIKAIVGALKAVPEVNSHLDGDTLVLNHYYDIGVAIGKGKGLVVPVLRYCDTASLAELERTLQAYTQKAIDGRLSLEDLQGGVFTLSNGGVYGSLLSTPLLNPPQSATLGMHKIQERPIALEGTIVIRPMMYVALSYDHRIIEGKQAITFLRHIKENLEAIPEAILKGYLDL